MLYYWTQCITHCNDFPAVMYVQYLDLALRPVFSVSHKRPLWHLKDNLPNFNLNLN